MDENQAVGALMMSEVGAQELYYRAFSTRVLHAFLTKRVSDSLSSKRAFSKGPLSRVL